MRKKSRVPYFIFFNLCSFLGGIHIKNNHTEYFIGVVMVGVRKIGNGLGMRVFRPQLLALSPLVIVTHGKTHYYFLVTVSLTVK